MNQQLIFYIATFLTAALGLIIGLVAYSYKKLISKYYALKEESEQKEKEAQAHSQKIIDEANARAQKIISEAENFNKILEQDLQKELQTAKAAYQKSYEAILGTVKQESIKSIGNISEDVKVEISAEVKTLLDSLKQEMIKSQESVIMSLKQELGKTEEDIKAYKADMYKKIDDSIIKIIQNVSHEVIGKSISIEDHEDLILNSLASAKRQGII